MPVASQARPSKAGVVIRLSTVDGPSTVDDVSRQHLMRRAATVGLLMRHCVNAGVAAIDEVLKGEKLNRLDRVVSQPVLPSVTDLLPQFDAFLAELEARMQTLYDLLCEKVKGTGIIEFSTIIKGVDHMEAVRTFILLLFLAQDGKVSLWQNEETEELYIAVGNLNVAKDQGTTR